MVTIKDVAKRANVAPSTVSRVIQDHESISDKTKDKVRKVMTELGYIPNVSARRLVTKQSHTIGLVLKSAAIEMRQNPFFTDVLMSITKVCNEHNYATMVTTSIHEDDLLEEVQELVKGNAVDGFVLLYSKENDAVLEYLQSIHFPFVIIGKQLDPLSTDVYIDNDNVQGSYQLTDYMIGLGHQHLAFIAEDDAYAVNKDRIAGFNQACSEHGVSGEVITGELSTLINQVPRVSAFITSDSMMNLKLLSLLYSAGIRVPEDVQTATFNDSYINENACPPQTVLDIFPESLGHEAGISLLEHIKAPNALKKSTIIPTRIIARQSTKPL